MQALQLRRAVEEGALAHPCSRAHLAFIACSRSQRSAALRGLQRRRASVKRAPGRRRLRVYVQRRQRIADSDTAQHKVRVAHTARSARAALKRRIQKPRE